MKSELSEQELRECVAEAVRWADADWSPVDSAINQLAYHDHGEQVFAYAVALANERLRHREEGEGRDCAAVHHGLETGPLGVFYAMELAARVLEDPVLAISVDGEGLASELRRHAEGVRSLATAQEARDGFTRRLAQALNDRIGCTLTGKQADRDAALLAEARAVGLLGEPVKRPVLRVKLPCGCESFEGDGFGVHWCESHWCSAEALSKAPIRHRFELIARRQEIAQNDGPAPTESPVTSEEDIHESDEATLTAITDRDPGDEDAPLRDRPGALPEELCWRPACTSFHPFAQGPCLSTAHEDEAASLRDAMQGRR